MRTLSRWLKLTGLLMGAAALGQSAPDVVKDAKAFEDATLLALAAEQSRRQGPGEVLTWFLEAAHSGDFAAASAALSLEHVPEAQRASEGPRLARRLMFLLDQQLTLEPEALARRDPTASLVTVGELPLRRFQLPVELVRAPAGTEPPWHFSARTVRSIDVLFAEHGSPTWELLPQVLVSRSFWVLGAWQWLGFLLLTGLALGVVRLVTAALSPVLMRLARVSTTDLDDKLVPRLRRPARALLFLAMMALGTRALVFPATAQGLVDDVVRSAVVATLVWAVLVISRLVAEALEARAAHDRDGHSARSVKTQVSVLHRVVDAVVLVVGGALVLLQFPGVRHIGMSMLASAGVAGVVVGLAAQRSIANLLAGIQISFTQPIRIGDTVIVEKEWGWIEEITLTYVVVKVWDLRRLVVPIGTFLEKPFQNWSRTSTEILGTVEVYADYRLDVEAARQELLRIVEGERGKLWNGKVQGVQVTALSERSMTLRALVSSDDASQNWDLRCLVRERLVAWLKQQPDGLPRVRTEGTGAAAGGLRA
jgi:small-conductance mechanosensitive channel